MYILFLNLKNNKKFNIIYIINRLNLNFLNILSGNNLIKEIISTKISEYTLLIIIFN